MIQNADELTRDIVDQWVPFRWTSSVPLDIVLALQAVLTLKANPALQRNTSSLSCGMLSGKRPRDACAKHERRVTSSSSASPPDRSVPPQHNGPDGPSEEDSKPERLHVLFRITCSHLFGVRQFFSSARSSRSMHSLHLHPIPHRHPLSNFAPASLRITQQERLTSMGCGFTAILSLKLPPTCASSSAKSSLRSMIAVYQRVVSKRATALLENTFQESQRMRCACNFAAAATGYKSLVALGHHQSHAELSWIMIDGREGVSRDIFGGLKMAQRGSQLGCLHSRGVLSYCHVYSYGCPPDFDTGYRLAFDSAAAGSKFGQLMLGALHLDGKGGASLDVPRALQLYKSAAAQGLDAAQFRLGRLHQSGRHVGRDAAEALRWFLLAAHQGHPWSCHEAADHYLEGLGTVTDRDEAVKW